MVKIGGWKTKVGAVAAILAGLAGAVQGIVNLLDGDFDTGIAAIKGGVLAAGLGLGTLGIGHKVEKTKAVLEGK